MLSSVINHKKNDKDIQRNSLVIESLEIIEKIKPRIFVLENVQAFEKTFCVTDKNEVMRIGDYIRKHLGDEYTISSRILNFMNYGSIILSVSFENSGKASIISLIINLLV